MTFDKHFCERVKCKAIGRPKPGSDEHVLCHPCCLTFETCPDETGDCTDCMKMHWKPEHCEFRIERLMSEKPE